MKSAVRSQLVMFAIICIGATLATLVMANNREKAQAYVEVTNRIEQHRKQRDVSALIAMANEIDQKWRETDVDMYGRATLKLVQELGSNNLGQYNKQHGKAQQIAMKALEKADLLPLEIECEMLRSVQSEFNENGEKLKGRAWEKLRKERLKLWLRAWKRIVNTIDKAWDPNDMPLVNVMPPQETGLPAGVAPGAIKDAQLRARYEAAVEANRRKIEKHRQQRQARMLQKYWLKDAQRSILHAYMKAPAANDELEKLLKEYGIDSITRDVILGAVKKKEIPGHLKLPRTQPSKQ